MGTQTQTHPIRTNHPSAHSLNSVLRPCLRARKVQGYKTQSRTERRALPLTHNSQGTRRSVLSHSKRARITTNKCSCAWLYVTYPLQSNIV